MSMHVAQPVNIVPISRNKNILTFAGRILVHTFDSYYFLKNARYSEYRVWCLKELRDRYSKLEEKDKTQVEILLKEFGCWEPLWRDKNLPLMDNQEEELPFKADRKMLGVNE